VRALDEIGFELNNICNFRCTHCLRDFSQEARNLPLELIERVLHEARIYRVSHLAFTGGEPTHPVASLPARCPRLAQILQVADRLGYTYHVVTNGSTLPRLWKRVFSVSLWFPSVRGLLLVSK
jgi:molybdenum cofactor biosynthesis enzyme MoaA